MNEPPATPTNAAPNDAKAATTNAPGAVAKDGEFLVVGFDRLAGRIAKYDEVKSCYLMSGGYDLLVIVEGESLREVARFVSEKLATIQGVLSTATHFMLKPYKEQGVLMAAEEGGERLAVSP